MKARHVLPLFLAAFALAAHGGEKAIKNGDTLVFMGDSITQFGKDTVDGYLRLVVQGLAANNINVTWYGVGISGQTAVQMKNRFQNDVVAKNPDVCTIFAGVNDCGSNWPDNTNSTPNDVAAMADMAIANGIKPVLLSPTGVNGEGFKQNVCDYAAAVKGIAQARSIPYAQTYEAFRECVDDPANPVINQFGYKATKDGTHMDVVGNRILAREVLKAFGFDATELANAEAAWNANAPFIEFHPSVQITEAEYMAVKAAAGRAGKSLGEYHRDLFYRGAELMKQNPVRVAATSGATVKLSATPLASLVTYDQMIDCGRAMSTHDSVPAIANYAMLAAVHELPAATAADLPTEPVQAVDTSVFSKQVEFTVSGYAGSSTLADFPVAVRLAAGSPSGFSYADMADPASGSELRFADGSGDSLSYEIEQWNPDGASLVWVKVPALSQGASFTMYYGGEPADAVEPRWTWKADYVGVWHMAEANGTVADSVNGLDAEPIGAAAATQQVAADGVFGKARVNSANAASYNGQSMLKVADSTLLDVGDDFTMSAWVKMTALTTVDGLARFASRNRGGGYAPDWELALPNYTTLNGYAGSLTAVSSTVPSAENSWVHIAAVFNGTTLTTYANGVKLADASISAVQDSDNKLIFGAKDKDVVQGHFTGLFDEFRLRDAVASADWVKAEYDQSSASFLVAGEATDVSGTPHTHTWGAPSYVWSADNATCTATAVCTGNSAHRKTQTSTAAYAVVQAPTADADGTGRYTATFTDALFSAQTKDIVLPRTGGGGGHVDPAGAIAPSGDATGAADRNAIQAAIDAAAPTGGTVMLGSGVFCIDAQLMVTNGVTLEGQGRERTVVRQVSSGDNMRVATVSGGATVSKVTLTGGNLSVTANYRYGGGALVNNGTISWCCISNNTLSCGNVAVGGGVAFTGPGTIDHSIVADNRVVSVSEDTNIGGGIGANQVSGAITIDACLVAGNSAINATQHRNGKGGGIGAISMWGTTMTVRNTTIVGNAAGGSGGVNNESKGGAVYTEGDTGKKLTMVNCIFADNTTMNGANMDLAYTGGVDHCLFDAAADMIGTNGKSGDPKFTNAAAGDYTIASDSPAKAAGTTYSGIGEDLSGNDFANPPSMGCYEYGSSGGGGGGGETHVHAWGAPTYAWSADNTACTGTATCTADSTHITNQTVAATYAVVQAATADATGTGRYTAVFDAPFATQTKDVVIPKTGGGGGGGGTHIDPEGAIVPSGDATGAVDRNAIQAAIDAAAPTGGTVTLGSGVFYIDAQLMVTNGVTLEGQGPERTIIRQVGSGRVATLAGEATLKDLTATGGTLVDQYVHGAGVYVENGTVSWCCISNNTVSGKGGYGGGVFFKQGAIDHSIVAFNTNDGNGGKGAGIGVNGDYSGPVTIDACLVLGNRAAYAWGASKGGGIGMELKNFGSPVTIRNTTIVGNVSGVEGRSSEGGALSVGSDYSSKLTMVNCIVAGNTTVGADADVKLHHATNVDYCLFDAADCVTIETSGEQVGAHCLVGDPKFADAAAGDYTLASDSPAKGAGATYSGIGTDLMGGDFANPPSMGCYEFGTTPPPPSIALGEPAARPGTDYNGSAVTVAFTGEIPAGAVASAALTIGGVAYAGTIDAANGTLSFAVPAGVATAGNAYEGTVSLTVDGVAYTKGVTLAQGTIKVDVNAAWIHETASAFGETGAWSGDKAVVADGAIAVSNATFTAATTAPRASVVTISSTFRFGDPSDEPFDTGSRAGITVVRADGANRYAVLTAAGVATNLAVVADVSAAVTVTVTLDDAAHTVSYSVGGVSLGTYALAERQTGVSTVRYVGPTDVVSLDGAYRFDGLDANLARAGGTEYATVADALASGADPVELLWDASWSPAVAGDYVFATNGHALVVGGGLAYRVTDNGDGTVTVTVTGDAATPEPASISVGASTVRVGVSGAKADRWYALEKTTDLAVDFAVDGTTWTKGSDLLAGTGELSIALDENEPAAFYRVVESDVAPSL